MGMNTNNSNSLFSSESAADNATTKYVPPPRRPSALLSQNSWRSKQDLVSYKKAGFPSSAPPSPSSSAPSSRRGSASSELSSSSTSSNSSYSSSPPTYGSGSTSKNWRECTPKTPSPSHNAKPAFDDLRPGQVLHLPCEDQVPKTSILHQRMVGRDDKPWAHPVVILEKKAASSELVKCQVVTSFQNGDTFAKKSTSSKDRIAPIQGIKPHVGKDGMLTRLLTLEPGSDKFMKPSYVNFYDKYEDGQFWIEYCHIQPWMPNGRLARITFDLESLERIKRQQVR
ncbi:hypothetical protein SLS60_000696 [Paraconiothyrium brasiliense]|uniref:Uncharacterized protein n=1 Tax=Paraconiothyrium brasiliense TaxID=300254 RepID=A0ABR3S703_9PLEO